MNWNDLLAAFALFLVLEGLFPFLNPIGFKKYLLMMLDVHSKKLRTYGFISMVLGVVLLSVVR